MFFTLTLLFVNTLMTNAAVLPANTTTEITGKSKNRTHILFKWKVPSNFVNYPTRVTQNILFFFRFADKKHKDFRRCHRNNQRISFPGKTNKQKNVE